MGRPKMAGDIGYRGQTLLPQGEAFHGYFKGEGTVYLHVYVTKTQARCASLIAVRLVVRTIRARPTLKGENASWTFLRAVAKSCAA